MTSLSLDFDGDYGRTYDTTIRQLVAGYDTFFELAAAALQVLVPQAQRVLVVGPGTGAELPAMVRALPAATFTLVEPSAAMRERCQAVVAGAGASERLQWGPERLEQAPDWELQGFCAVITHNVVHLMPAEQQTVSLAQWAARLAPGGALLLSAYSEPEAGDLTLWQAMAQARFAAVGLDQEMIEAVLASRDRSVFSLAPARLAESLAASGLEPPRLLMQTLFNRLWFSRRPPLSPPNDA